MVDINLKLNSHQRPASDASTNPGPGKKRAGMTRVVMRRYSSEEVQQCWMTASCVVTDAKQHCCESGAYLLMATFESVSATVRALILKIPLAETEGTNIWAALSRPFK